MPVFFIARTNDNIYRGNFARTYLVKLNVDDVEERLEDDALTEAFRKAVKDSIEEGFK